MRLAGVGVRGIGLDPRPPTPPLALGPGTRRASGLPTPPAELIGETGQAEPGLACVGFATLGLQAFLTAGPKESRAWTIQRDWTASRAAGLIHTDFEKGFIKAQGASFEDLVALVSITEARAHGKTPHGGQGLRDGDDDVVEARFNV
jgi:ribosome-binding ATPase YchF (GTP1/OBG family)